MRSRFEEVYVLGEVYRPKSEIFEVLQRRSMICGEFNDEAFWHSTNEVK